MASSVFQPSPSGSLKTSQQPVKINMTNEVVSVIASMEEVPVQTGIELGSECVETRTETSHDAGSATVPTVVVENFSQRPPQLGIPETSYSSSEDEDFYDASENMGQSPTLPSYVYSITYCPLGKYELTLRYLVFFLRPTVKLFDVPEAAQRSSTQDSIDYDGKDNKYKYKKKRKNIRLN